MRRHAAGHRLVRSHDHRRTVPEARVGRDDIDTADTRQADLRQAPPGFEATGGEDPAIENPCSAFVPFDGHAKPLRSLCQQIT